jgi:hypothetical protein
VNLLNTIIETASASDVRMLEVCSVLAGVGLGALVGHRWQARSHRGDSSSGRRLDPPAAGSPR